LQGGEIMKKTITKWAVQLACGILLSLVGFYISRIFLYGGSMGMTMKKVMIFVSSGAIIGTIIGGFFADKRVLGKTYNFNILPIVTAFILGGARACFGLLFFIFVGGAISVTLYLFTVILFSSIGYNSVGFFRRDTKN
jgi:hypothetical protein